MSFFNSKSNLCVLLNRGYRIVRTECCSLAEDDILKYDSVGTEPNVDLDCYSLLPACLAARIAYSKVIRLAQGGVEI